MTHSNLKKTIRELYLVQRKTKSGRWVPVYPEITCQRGYDVGLRILRQKIWDREHRRCYWNHTRNKRTHYAGCCKSLGQLRLVKLDIVSTEQKFYTPTKIKARKQ